LTLVYAVRTVYIDARLSYRSGKLGRKTMAIQDADDLRAAVRERYGEAATAAASGTAATDGASFGAPLYEAEELAVLPQAAVAASLGCGNPTALAELRPGMTVLDLGSGGGIDVLLSARRVAPGGRAYGLDMTPEMVELARRNQAESGVENAEFLLGSIEAIPLPDASVDVIISNCVVNLSPDKPQVLGEAFRVLRPGGRLAISDIVLTTSLPPVLAGLVGLWTGCVAGALVKADLEGQLAAAGFGNISVEPVRALDRAELAELANGLDRTSLPADLDAESTLDALDGVITSSFIRARRPA
jgi:SAM-dependent methyltransferase